MLELTKTLLIEEYKAKKSGAHKKKGAKNNWRHLFKDLIEKQTEQGAFLNGLRLIHGYTQVQLGKLIGVSQSNISSMEQGKRPIGKKIARRLADVFGVNYQQFL